MCERACVCARARARVRAYVYVCVREVTCLVRVCSSIHVFLLHIFCSGCYITILLHIMMILCIFKKLQSTKLILVQVKAIKSC